ncbi:MAG TPA: hypothetical protein VFX59_18515 [Polyangiales bacterium]|nr:hypothetical protein [Polyangiales bacterium]
MNTRHLSWMLPLAFATACNKDEATHEPARATRAAVEPKAGQASPDAEPVPVWPDGWMLLSEDDWIPVMNRAGAELTAARAAFLAGAAVP